MISPQEAARELRRLRSKLEYAANEKEFLVLQGQIQVLKYVLNGSVKE